MNWDKYRSRKFIITLIIIALASVLAYMDKMGGDVALILTACITSYNVSQGWIDGKA